jgi:carlactone C-19 oxidase
MMQSYIERVVQSVSKVSAEEDVPFSELSLKLATDIIGQAAFGIDFALTKENSNYNINMDKECQSFIKEHIYSTTSLKMDLSGSFSTILGLIMPFYKVHLGKY